MQFSLILWVFCFSTVGLGLQILIIQCEPPEMKPPQANFSLEVSFLVVHTVFIIWGPLIDGYRLLARRTSSIELILYNTAEKSDLLPDLNINYGFFALRLDKD